MKTVLFLCTGNYYRSRFAEELFNHLATSQGLAWRADSAGLDPTPANPGPISRYTLEAFARLKLARPVSERFPRRVTNEDFAAADLVIAVKEVEHRPMMLKSFPEQLPQVEFWQVHDIDCAAPCDTIADLEERVTDLVERLQSQATLAA
ncbi:MAG TPA: low molecular weight phosphatase family protein [Caulifigura sp.]|nr:low molecular weight phosphatase family protein [Caulifigura sp.]